MIAFTGYVGKSLTKDYHISRCYSRKKSKGKQAGGEVNAGDDKTCNNYYRIAFISTFDNYGNYGYSEVVKMNKWGRDEGNI